MIILTKGLLISIVLTHLNAFNISNYVQTILEIAKNQSHTIYYENSISRLMELEPHYFDYSPYNSNLRKFSCVSELVQQQSTLATSVNQLKPTDIKYVAALGDSLTAALGADAKTLLELLFEYRGKSWSIGGDGNLDCVVSLPNILRQFNPSVRGFSEGKEYLLFDKVKSHLNVAVSGNEAKDMPKQARELIARFKTLYEDDYKKQWKLITLFIGANDLCDYCNDRELHSPKSYVAYLRLALDLLASELPRSFVNLVSVLNVSPVRYMGQNLICKLIHQRSCACAAYPQSIEQEREIDEFVRGYVNLTRELIETNRYERNDFTVVIQPFFEETTPPLTSSGKVDLTYFAPDCFHFSQKGHTQAAIALWNSMLTPVSLKPRKWNLNGQFKCPDLARPYFSTRNN